MYAHTFFSFKGKVVLSTNLPLIIIMIGVIINLLYFELSLAIVVLSDHVDKNVSLKHVGRVTESESLESRK